MLTPLTYASAEAAVFQPHIFDEYLRRRHAIFAHFRRRRIVSPLSIFSAFILPLIISFTPLPLRHFLLRHIELQILPFEVQRERSRRQSDAEEH
jgi:hypothetical protein